MPTPNTETTTLVVATILLYLLLLLINTWKAQHPPIPLPPPCPSPPPQIRRIDRRVHSTWSSTDASLRPTDPIRTPWSQQTKLTQFYQVKSPTQTSSNSSWTWNNVQTSTTNSRKKTTNPRLSPSSTSSTRRSPWSKTWHIPASSPPSPKDDSPDLQTILATTLPLLFPDKVDYPFSFKISPSTLAPPTLWQNLSPTAFLRQPSPTMTSENKSSILQSLSDSCTLENGPSSYATDTSNPSNSQSTPTTVATDGKGPTTNGSLKEKRLKKL